MAKGTKYSQQFKEDAVQYRLDHPDLPLRKAAENLGVSESALKNWMKATKEHKGEVPTRGSGNYASEEAKEIARLQRELRDTKDALEVLKKSNRYSGKLTKALYTATSEYVKEIKSLPVKRQVSVSGILKKLGVSRSGYNAWKKRVPSDTSVRRAVLKEKIQKIYEESHQNYGAPKITAELRKSGEYVSEKTVGNYMRQMGIKAHWVKPYIQTTIDSDFSQKLKNILNEEFNPAHPDAVWCSDITYIWTFEGFVYLTSVMDLYSRKIISWVLSETLEASHVVECVEKAKRVRNVEKPLIFHCDRGCQYVSEAFQKATKDMIRSYSKKAYPWDNACIESFHALLKREWINRFKIFNYAHAHKLIFEYIETFYNTVRIHSHCGYLSPNEYEEQYLENIEENAVKIAS
mgnify:CR=1 FL=1